MYSRRQFLKLCGITVLGLSVIEWPHNQNINSKEFNNKIIQLYGDKINIHKCLFTNCKFVFLNTPSVLSITYCTFANCDTLKLPNGIENMQIVWNIFDETGIDNVNLYGTNYISRIGI